MDSTTINKYNNIIINIKDNNSIAFQKFLISKFIDKNTYKFEAFCFSSADEFKDYVIRNKPKRILIDKHELEKLFFNEQNAIFKIKKMELPR